MFTFTIGLIGISAPQIGGIYLYVVFFTLISWIGYPVLITAIYQLIRITIDLLASTAATISVRPLIKLLSWLPLGY